VVEVKHPANGDPVQEAINALLAKRAEMDAKRAEMLSAASVLAAKMAELSALEVDVGNLADTVNDVYNH
jgi:hypothetical protein